MDVHIRYWDIEKGLVKLIILTLDLCLDLMLITFMMNYIMHCNPFLKKTCYKCLWMGQIPIGKFLNCYLVIEMKNSGQIY